MKNKALVVNFYGNGMNLSGAQRSTFWQNFLSDSHDVDHYSEVNVVPWHNYLKRLVNLVFSRRPLSSQQNLAAIIANSQTYDLVVLCIPAYELLEMVGEISTKVVVDLRDGIYHESLYFDIEKWRYGKYLKKLESNIRHAAFVTSNVPSLQTYYTELLGRDVHLLLRDNQVRSRRNVHPREHINAVFSGGLSRSSRGLNLVNFAKACERFNQSTPGRQANLTLIGSFNFVEKYFYRRLGCRLEAQIPHNQLLDTLCDFNLLVVAVNTKRALLPSKVWTYLCFDAPLVCIGESVNLRYLKEQISGMTNLQDSQEEIFEFLCGLDSTARYHRDLIIEDNRAEFLHVISA